MPTDRNMLKPRRIVTTLSGDELINVLSYTVQTFPTKKKMLVGTWTLRAMDVNGMPGVAWARDSAHAPLRAWVGTLNKGWIVGLQPASDGGAQLKVVRYIKTGTAVAKSMVDKNVLVAFFDCFEMALREKDPQARLLV